MSKKTIALIISLVILTTALLAIALTAEQPIGTSQQFTDSSKQQENIPTPTPAAQTIMSLSPSTVNATTGLNEIDVVLDAGSNTISTAQIELAYDPKLIYNVKIIPGTYIKNAREYINQNDTTTGRFSYAIGVFLNQEVGKGKGVFAKISFNARPATLLTKETELTLLSKSAANQPGVSVSVLKETKGAKVILPTNGSAAPVQPTTSTQPTTSPTQ